jgi:hypothetical protein
MEDEHMKLKFTMRLSAAVIVGAMFLSGSASGQDVLGDDFILFVNGTNVLIPSAGGTPAADPFDAENTVQRFDYGNFSLAGFEWERTVGVDMSANIASGDTLFLRLLSDPANLGQPNVSLSFTDKTDDSGADDGTADNEFRAQWVIPQGMHDGNWHDLAIPLPPATWQELQDAKDGGLMDSIFTAWQYGGAWSTGGFPIALDGLGPNSPDRPDLFREFEWTNTRILGPFFDNNTNVGGSIYLDDVYIGNSGLDLSAANDPAEAMSGVTFADMTGYNSISWAANANLGGYKAYVSESEITDVTADGVELLETLAFDDDLEVQHVFEWPDESFSGSSFYYAVTSLSFFGVENQDVTASSGSVSNATLPVQPIILEMTDDEATTVFNNLAAGNVSSEGFPNVEPFRLNSSHQSQGDGSLPPDDADLSGVFYTGFSNLNEFFVYAEVTDDFIQLGSVVSGADAWQWDSIEMGWGNYDVRDAGGSVLTSTPHQNFERGPFADYQFRIAAFDDENTGEIIGTSAFVAGSINADVQGGGVAYDTLADGSGNVIGWKVLALFPLDAIQSTADGDVVLDPPTGTEVRLIPFNIALNDDDGSGREHQTLWSVKSNADGQWWNTPNQWPAVAMSGRATQTAVEGEDDVPTTHSLEQNYPNPFNPTTAIRFNLAQNELVTLKVYNLLGQQVATLLNNEQMSAGAKSVTFSGQGLSSGMYLYKIEAGSFVQTKQMILLK